MREADLAAVMRIEPRAYSHHWSEGIFRDCLDKLLPPYQETQKPGAGYIMPGLFMGDHLIGYAVYSLVACEAHLLNITVAPEYKGRGLGRYLLDAIVGDCRERGAEMLYLEVRPSNRPAIGLYENTGFIDIGIRKDYYPSAGEREDARVMALALVEGGL
ncbi:ribosomal-protein-alanine acetyltransferase [gamma proteobacterium HTCC5015]|nr:ribosomal-protein-alanine acetyltransferase [gamma proteobacterium HTCC5015]